MHHPRSRRGLIARLASAAVLAGAFPAWTGVLGAQTSEDPKPPAITDYENYPLGLGLIPEGCTSEGPDVVNGEQFSLNGGPPVADLRDIGEAQTTDTLTMTWDSFAPGCEEIGIGLSAKVSLSTVFDPNDDQVGTFWAYCGPGGLPCEAPFELTLIGVGAEVPCFQIDAHIGPELEVVGPSGSFYGFGQPFNMLISAWNGGREPCDEFPRCELDDRLPAESVLCEDLEVGGQTTTTAAPTTTTLPPDTAPDATVQGTQVSQTIARTGSSTTAPGTALAVAMIAGGIALAIIARRRISG